METGLNEQLEFLRKTIPPYFPFDVADLDEILAGENLEQHRLAIADGVYLSELGLRIDWWFALWEALMIEGADKVDHDLAGNLATEITGRCAIAQLKRPGAKGTTRKASGADPKQLTDQGADSDLDLLRSYRRFTRLLRDAPRKALPGIDLGWLWGVA